MPPQGKPRSFYKKFKFVVEIGGVASAGFQKCSKLEGEVTVAQQNEGGSLIPDKSAARAKFSDVTLTRGATDDLDLFNWFKQTVNAAANSGAVDGVYKRDFDIVQQDRDGTVRRRWRVTNAFPVKFTPGEWDNDSDDNSMEEVTLTFDYFDLA
jgi:phage tail-like protein